MKIAITTEGKDLSAPIDQRFGRAGGFVIYDTQSHEFSINDNTQNLNAAQGAGIQAAQNVVNLGAQAVITGHCGPKAFKVLSASGVKVYSSNAATIEEALTLFNENKLECLSGADVEGHWV